MTVRALGFAILLASCATATPTDMVPITGASPLEDYSLGRAEINVGTAVIPAMAVTTALEGMGSSTDKTDARNRIEGGATVGLGHNLALQFKYVDSQRKPGDAEYNMRTQEYNLRCKQVHIGW